MCPVCTFHYLSPLAPAASQLHRLLCRNRAQPVWCPLTRPCCGSGSTPSPRRHPPHHGTVCRRYNCHHTAWRPGDAPVVSAALPEDSLEPCAWQVRWVGGWSWVVCVGASVRQIGTCIAVSIRGGLRMGTAKGHVCRVGRPGDTAAAVGMRLAPGDGLHRNPLHLPPPPCGLACAQQRQTASCLCWQPTRPQPPTHL